MKENTIIIKNGASSEILKDGYSLTITEIKNWLINKNILSGDDDLLDYTDLQEWKRGGAETYWTIFQIRFCSLKGIELKKIVIKAIVSIPVEENLLKWQRCRKTMKLNGVAVSNWYWVGNGIIIEDFYPNTFESVKDFDSLIEIALSLDKLGFSPLGFLRDTRCSEAGEPFFIDFGFDLGDFSYFNKKVSIGQLIEFFPEKKSYINNYVNSKFKRKF